MCADEEGFFYPVVNINSCINCGTCEFACPILNDIPEKPFSQYGFIVQNKDEKILQQSTSGGVFSAITAYIISQNGIVFDATLSDNFQVKHIHVESMLELKLLRGSKYVQSDIGNTL